MAISLKNLITDGQVTFERGVDTYRAPVRVPRNQCCLLVNSTTRQDFIGTRPGWRQIPLLFVTFNPETGQYDPDSTLQTSFEQGFFQKFSGYVPDNGPSHLVFSISGKLYRVNPLGGNTVSELATPNPRPTTRRYVWFEQAELFLICQDGQSVPLIYDGTTLRESDTLGKNGTDPDGKPLYEVPVGECMAYSMGRLWVTLPDGITFVAGDGVYGPTGTEAYQSRDSVLKFTENSYLNEFPGFAVPANLAPIRAMVPLANLDTSLGQGPLQVFTPSGCFSIEAPFDRTQWALMTNPIKTVSLIDQGALSDAGVQLVNGDAWYRSLDGWRSFFIARRDFGTWGNRALSYEVIRHIKDDDVNLLDRCSCALFDNRLLGLCSPQWDAQRGVYHKGLVALDFIPLTSMAGSEPPCWDGLWTSLDILQIVTVQSQGVDHCYAAVLAGADDNGVRKIQLWELTKNTGVDTSSVGEKIRIQRAFEGPKLDFGNRLEQKELEGFEIWLDKAFGTIDFILYYRPDEYPCWLEWKRWQICSTTERCAVDAVDGCVTNLNLREQFRPRVSALRPPDYVLQATDLPSRIGYTFQYRLETQGDVEITAVRLLAKRIPEPTFGTSLPETATCEEIVCCEPDNFLGSPGSTPFPPPPVPPEPTPPDDPSGPALPGVPPYTLLPTYPGDSLPDCAQGSFRGTWTFESTTAEIGTEDPTAPDADTLASWASSLWQQFSDAMVADTSIRVTQAYIVWLEDPSTAPSGYERFLAQFVYGTIPPNYTTAFGYNWVLKIAFCWENT